MLESANIVFTTLSSSGLGILEDLNLEEYTFETVVVDEAAQAIEVSNLIPLRFGCKQCVMVGDPKQLPATVFSRAAAAHSFERSLFERLEKAGHPVTMLDTQYRCHPSIAEFPVSAKLM